MSNLCPVAMPNIQNQKLKFTVHVQLGVLLFTLLEKIVPQHFVNALVPVMMIHRDVNSMSTIFSSLRLMANETNIGAAYLGKKREQKYFFPQNTTHNTVKSLKPMNYPFNIDHPVSPIA